MCFLLPYLFTKKNNVKFSKSAYSIFVHHFNSCNFLLLLKWLKLEWKQQRYALKMWDFDLTAYLRCLPPIAIVKGLKISLLGRMHNVRNCTSNASDSFCDLENATFLLLILPILPNFISKKLPLDNLILLGVVYFIIQHLGCVPLLFSKQYRMWMSSEVCCQYASLDSETYEVIGDHTDRRVMAIRRDTGAIQAGRRVSPLRPICQ